jgi:hypothetical protein
MSEEDRVYKFEIGQKVRIKDGVAGRDAEVLRRQAEPDHEQKYDIKRFPDGRVTCKSRKIPMNSYMVQFIGKTGRLDTAWHNEDTLIAG